VYYFGGKQGDGKLVNKLRYFKPVTVDRKVVQGEFIPIKTNGEPPCPRFGHTMSYLPINSAIIIAGGRNDSLCKEHITPLLNDIHLFLLDQKVWIRVKFSFNSDKLDFIGNHTMGVITDGDSFEKIVVFGGIQNVIKEDASASNSDVDVVKDHTVDVSSVLSFLSNKCFLVTIQQRSSGKSFFKDEPSSQPSKATR